ncbi:hypothetical protein [Tomitella biformata]|uniref:hypothetical protein n=1 Tax=Tomitella biformata TaxID=630403 RepID=UPI0004669871|nr:hypothetical protein [Tomitella biformata]
MTDNPTKSRRPSATLLLLGLVALGISGWVLLGPGTFQWMIDVDGRWYLVAAAGIAGLALVLAPAIRRRR